MTPRPPLPPTYNTNPSCLNTPTVTRTINPTFAMCQIIIWSIVTISMLATSVHYLAVRKRFARLKSRDWMPLVVGTSTSVAFILTRAYYDYVGREYMPCTYSLLLYYVAIPIGFFSDIQGMGHWIFSSAKRRQLLQARALGAFLPTPSFTVGTPPPPPTKSSKNTIATSANLSSFRSIDTNGGGGGGAVAAAGGPSSVTVSSATDDNNNNTDHIPVHSIGSRHYLKLWLQGFRLYVRVIANPATSIKTHQTKAFLSNEDFVAITPPMLFSFQCLVLAISTIPALLAYLIRINTSAHFVHCTGCQVELTDFAIVVALSAFGMCYSVSYVFYALWVKHLPDPLGVFRSHLLSVAMGFGIGGAGTLLALLDPGQVMQHQDFDWFEFELSMLVLIQIIRGPYQVWRTRKTHQKALATIRLLDVLSDARGSVLFESFLKSELADENLKFWRETVKWKLSYDRDLSSSQQMARILFKTFVEASSVLPINLSDATRNAVTSRFKAQKVVSRTVFDEALIEVYKMMEQGAFLRFTETPAYKKFKNVATDFSVATMGVFNLTDGGIGFERHMSSSGDGGGGGTYSTSTSHHLSNTNNMPRKSDLSKMAASGGGGTGSGNGSNASGAPQEEFHISTYVSSL